MPKIVSTMSKGKGKGKATSSSKRGLGSTADVTKTDITLFCVVDGEASAFSATVLSSDTVDSLKNAIKGKKPIDFADVDADRLTLWQVSVPDDGKAVQLSSLPDKKKKLLRATHDVSDYFQGTPPKRTIHIIVQKPDSARKRDREDDEVDRDTKRSCLRTKTDRQLWDDWHKYLRSNITVHIPPELYPKEWQESTGRFQKAGSRVPFSGSGFVDLRLDTKPTAMGEKLATSCKQEGEPTGDRNFMRFYKDMKRVDNEHGLDTAKGRLESERLIALEYTSRMFFLILLLEKVKDLTPRGYLLSQLNGGQKSIEEIKDSLIGVEGKELSFLFRKSLARLKFAIAIDEATVGSKLLYGKFTNVNNQIKGVLTPLLKYLGEHEIPKIIAGTSFSLRHGEQIRSDIGKGVTQEYLSEFEQLDITAVEMYIQKYLDFSDCDFTNIENWEYLAGRPRLAARLLLETVQSERKFGGSITKQSILETAVKNTLTAVSEKLTERLNTLATEYIDSRDPQKSLMQDALQELFLSCRFFGGSSRLGELDDNWTRLVDCGVVFLTTTPDGMFVHLEELLAIRTVNLVLGLRYTRPTETLIYDLFKKLAASALAQDTSKGKAWEYLVLSALLSYNGTMVRDFVRIFYGDSSVILPQWTSHAVLNVASYGDADMFTLLSGFPHEDDVDVIDKFLRDPNRRTYILQPANIMRPDGLYIGSLHNRPAREYWTLLFSAKFYNTAMSSQQTIDEDRASTDWSLACHTKKGKVKATGLVTKFQGVQGYSAHQGSLRIHFVLPGLAASKDGSPRGGIQVEDNDVLMYIDRSLLEELFQSMPDIAKGLNKLLEK